jgi:hypothetical protein
VERKKMRDINVGKRERETWNESERLGEKKERRKKGVRENETYERIQEKKKLIRIITSKLNF